VGQRFIHDRQAGSTRTTGVCCSITSLTRTPHALVPGARHGRSRAFASYQAMALSASVMAGPTVWRVHELAITVIGPDRTGIVADVAEALAGVGANLSDSTMTRLRGHFAMTLICTGVTAEAVEKALAPIGADGRLLATVRAVQPETDVDAAGEPYLVSVHGADRLGIVAAVTRVVAAAGGNITDLTTRLTGPLYVLVAEVDLPRGAADGLATRLAETAAELGVDVTLRRADSEIL
jgi:glycine cleavage system transcriptional repressor